MESAARAESASSLTLSPRRSQRLSYLEFIVTKALKSPQNVYIFLLSGSERFEAPAISDGNHKLGLDFH